MRTLPWIVLALLVAAGAVMLRVMPVRHYAVTCTRAAEVTCELSRARAGDEPPTTVRLDAGASAVVRVRPQRRGAPRVFVYLRSPASEHFAAEFEGADADEAAQAAATRLNTVLTGSAPGPVRIDVEPPPIYRRLALAALGVMALITLAGFREARRRASPA